MLPVGNRHSQGWVIQYSAHHRACPALRRRHAKLAAAGLGLHRVAPIGWGNFPTLSASERIDCRLLQASRPRWRVWRGKRHFEMPRDLVREDLLRYRVFLRGDGVPIAVCGLQVERLRRFSSPRRLSPDQCCIDYAQRGSFNVSVSNHRHWPETGDPHFAQLNSSFASSFSCPLKAAGFCQNLDSRALTWGR